MSGGAGGSFRGVEILVKLVKLGIGQKVLGIWNWAFDKNYKPYLARAAPRLGPGAADLIADAHSAGPIFFEKYVVC